MSAILRRIVSARQTVGDQVAASLLPLEQNAHALAIEASRCLATILEAHTSAALPPAAGMEAIELIADAGRLAAQLRGRIGAAHDHLRELALTHNLPVASYPACPPNDPGSIINLPFGG